MGSAIIIQALKPVFDFVATSIRNIFDVFKTLPSGVQTLGLVGFLMLGTRGKAIVLLIGCVFDTIRGFIGDLASGYAFFLEKVADGLEKTGMFKDEIANARNVVQDFRNVSERLNTPFKDLTKDIKGSNNELDGSIAKLEKFLMTLEAKALISKKQVEELLNKLKGTNEEVDKSAVQFTKIADTVKNQIKKDLESVNETIGKFILGGVKSFSRALAESVVLGKKLKMSFEEIAKKFLVDILAFTIQMVIQKQIEKMLSDGQVKNEEKITDEKKKQLKIQGMMMMMSGNPLGILGFASPGFAQGGAVSKGKPIMVGERGPEMFIPNSTGQITQNARGMGGGSAVVNFNINTIDSRGFDQALIENRGTITSIINNALTEKGRGALV